MNLGYKIKKLRKENGLTQKDLALKANMSRSYLADLEGNRYNPSLDVIKSITKALGITMDEFFKEDNNNSIPTFTISTLRKENKLSADELDKALRLPDNTIENIENGRTELSKDVLNKLSDFFKVQKDYILGKSSERYKGEIDDLEIDLKNAMDKIRRISPDDRKKLLQILDIFDSKTDN